MTSKSPIPNADSIKPPLTPAQWAEIEELWAMGDSTLEELGARYDRNPTYISRELSKRGVKKGSKAGLVQQRVKEQVHEDEVKRSAEVIRMAKETRSEHYTFSRTLSRLAFKLIADKVAKGESVASVKEEIRVIKDAQAAIAMGRHERWIILGLDKDENAGEERTTLVVKEMTDEDIRRERERQTSDFEDELEEVEKAIEGIDIPDKEDAD